MTSSAAILPPPRRPRSQRPRATLRRPRPQQRSDITCGRLLDHFYRDDVFRGRHMASSLLAGLRSSSSSHSPIHKHDYGRPARLRRRRRRSPWLSRGLIRLSPILLPSPQRLRPQQHSSQSSARPRHGNNPCGRPMPPCPRRHGRGRLVASRTAVTLRFPSPPTKPQPSRGLVCGDGLRFPPFLPRQPRTQQDTPDSCLRGNVH